MDNLIRFPRRCLSDGQVTSLQLVMTAILCMIEKDTIPPPKVQESIFRTMLRGFGHLPFGDDEDAA